MSEFTAPPALPDLLANPMFREATPQDRVRVLRQWKADTMAFGRATVPGWAKQHEEELDAQLPDREGVLGRLAELGSGIDDAFVNQAPADLAAVVQGRDVPLSPDTWTERLKAEQVQDRARRPHSLQTLAGEKFGEALATGPSSIVTSAVTGLSGAALGGAAGSGVPVIGNLAGAAIGAGTLSGAAMYRIAANNFLTQVRDHLSEQGIAPTPDQWKQTKQDLDSEATKYGLWEAGPEALSQAFTAGLFNGTLGKLAGKIPGLSATTSKIARSAIAKTAAKYGGKLAAKGAAEIGEELATETATQVGQGEIEARHDLRDHAPTLGEAFREVAGPTIVGAVLQAGAYAGAERAKHLLTRQLPNDKPATPPAPNSSPAATPGEEAGAPSPKNLNSQPSTLNSETDLASEIGASLPDAESRDVLAGRSTEAEARKLADAKVDFGATVQSVQDALLTAGATPAQLDALDFQLRVLEERKDKRRLRPDQVNTSLANTFLFQALPPAEVFPLVSRLAADTANIQQLRAGLAALRTGAAPTTAPAAAPATNVSPTPAPGLTPEQRAAKLAVLQQAEQEAAAAKAKAETDREQARLKAEADQKAQAARVRAENARLATLERTGRDETGKIADLTRVPDTEMAGLDLEREGITEAQFAAEMDRRARAEERNAATAGNRGEELLDVLAQVKLPGESATLPEELRTLIREGMTAKQRMALVRAGVGELDRTAEALRGRGFIWAKTPADVIDHVQRALRGEMIYAEGTPDDIQFARRTRPAPADPTATNPLAARWFDNLSLVAPGVAREVELRFGDPEQLVEAGTVRASDLTGEEEAATVRQSREGARSIVYLFDRALRKNTDAVTRLNLLHEIGHLFFDTLDAATRRALRDQWNTERTTRTGPLFTAEGNLRENVALGVFDEANPSQALHEWFAERLAHANDTWAKRRTDVRAQGDGILRTVAAEFRAMLLQLRELLERAFGRNGYDDQLVSDFRQFLDQGDRWNQDGPDADAELAGSFAKTGLPFASRAEPTERNLVAVHNTTAEKLAQIDELGGLAAPSIAIIRRDRSTFNGFGNITLVAGPQLIDPAAGRDAQVFNADVYSPRFPSTAHKVSTSALRAAWQKLGAWSKKLGNVLSSELDETELERNGFAPFADSTAALATFLDSKGITPETRNREVADISEPLKAFTSRNYFELEQNPDFQRAAAEYFRDLYADHPNVLDDVLDEKGAVMPGPLSRIARQVVDYNHPQLDRYATQRAMSDQVAQAGLTQEFDQWVRRTFADVFQGKLVRDYNERSDTARWLPYNLANVLRVMKRASTRDGEGMNYGVGNIRATVARQFKTVAAIRAAGDAIVSEADFQLVKAEVNKTFQQLADELRPFYRFQANRFGYLDEVSTAMKELAQEGPRKWAENFKEVPAPLMTEVQNFLAKLRNMPTEYFEAKVRQGVFLNEFVGAVIPSDTDQATRTILKRKGLAVVEYPRGDAQARAAAVNQLATERNVQFARRTDANPEGREPEQLLRDYASLERTRDRYVSDGQTVPRHILTGLADLREALEESLPGWRNQAKAIAAEQTVTTAPSAEPEAGASALFPSDDGTVAPEETATKRSQLEASTLRRPTGVRDWLASLGRLFTNFRSAIPELPGGAKGRVFTAFRQGYRMMRAATEFTRKDAEEKVGHILAPLTGLGPDAIAPETYRELQKLQQIRQEQMEAGKPIRPELTRRIATLDAQLDAVPYHLFRKVALYRDLFFRSRLEAPNGEPLRLPFGLTAAEIETTLRDLHAKVKASPHAAQIEESLRRHYALVKEVRDGLLARGYVIPEELRNPLYFPHIVIDKASGSISRVKLDTAEDFRGYLVRLVGSERAIESDYLQAMYYHLATVEAHNARQDIVARYWQPYDIKADLVKQAAEMTDERKARGLGSINWRQLVPEGHVIYTVDDRIPLRPEYLINRQVLAEKLGVQLGEGDLQKQLRDLGMSVTLTAEDFQAALMAGEKTQWVVPKPVADALRAILDREARTAGLAERVLTTPQSLWKRWTLFAPQNVIRYTYGNMVADLEKLFSADPGVFRQLRPAMEEVRAFYDGQKPSADLRAAFERGVLDAVTVGEVTDLAREQLDQFAAFTTSRERFVGMLKRGLGWGVTVNRIREASFRYAKFKADLERQRAGAEPIYAGAYNRDVRAIREDTPEATHYARAAEISRKTFGDYADISVSGDGLRKYFIPFYSWMEVNFRYHANLFRNLGDMGAGAGAAQIARGTAAAASRILVARSATGVLLRLAVPYAAVALWNNSGDREDLEKTLSDEDRRRFHLILGKDAQGRTLVAYAPTALSDVMKWFGGNEFARLAGEYIRGQITFPQLAHEWISNTPGDVLNNALQGISPQIKAAMIATTRKQPFPDILNQRSIADYDLRWAVLGSTTDGLTADALRRLLDDNYYSGKSWGDWAQQNILQARRRDPEQWGFYATMDRVAAYQKAHGGTVDLGVNNKADAEMLGSFRRAIRAGDVPAALNFYQKLLDNGYTAERFRASIDHADPLATLKREVRKEFVAGLSPAEQEDLRNGYKYAARMQAFDHRERQLFPSEKATRDYRARYAAQGGRPDVFAGIMETFANQPEDQLELRAETLMRSALRPVKR